MYHTIYIYIYICIYSLLLRQNIPTRLDLKVIEFKRLKWTSRFQFICTLYSKLPIQLKRNSNINLARASSIISPRSQQILFQTKFSKGSPRYPKQIPNHKPWTFQVHFSQPLEQIHQNLIFLDKLLKWPRASSIISS